MFDYKGYSEDLLERLCSAEYVDRGLLTQYRYWPSEAYSIGQCLRLYSNYPFWLPLYVYSRHGSGYIPCGFPHEINNDAPAMLVFNQKEQIEYQSLSNKPCYLVTMPYVQYRKKKEIKQKEKAYATLALPVHSSTEMELVFDIENYIENLKALPDEFHPICVCLHMSDIQRGRHLVFLNHGFPVYTAGHSDDINFIARFYSILKNFKYTTSNHVGSYTYYSVEMDIPFSLYGENGYLKNETDPGLPLGAIVRFTDSDFYGKDFGSYYNKAIEVFSGLNRVISLPQKEFVEECLGIYQGISGEELKKILWKAAKSNKIRLFKDSLKALKNKLKQIIKKPVNVIKLA